MHGGEIFLKKKILVSSLQFHFSFHKIFCDDLINSHTHSFSHTPINSPLQLSLHELVRPHRPSSQRGSSTSPAYKKNKNTSIAACWAHISHHAVSPRIHRSSCCPIKLSARQSPSPSPAAGSPPSSFYSERRAMAAVLCFSCRVIPYYTLYCRSIAQ